MRVCVTGVTGYIGSAVARELIARGHEVSGLVRSQSSLGRVPEGVRVIWGDLASTPARTAWIRDAVESNDAFLHCAADMQLASAQGFNEMARAEEAFLSDVLAAARARPSAPFLVVMTTSIAAVIGQPAPQSEYAAVDKVPAFEAARFESERRFIAAGNDKVRTCVVRPGWVYGGGAGLLRTFAQMSVRAMRPPAVVAGGTAPLLLVHVNDIARLYAMLVENPRCTGAFHAVAPGNTTTWRAFAEALSRAAGMDGSVIDVSYAAAQASMGMFADLLTMQCNAVSVRPQEFGFEFKEPHLMPNFAKFYTEIA